MSLIKGAIRRLLTLLAKSDPDAKAATQAALVRDDYDTTGKPAIDWDDEDARAGLVDELVLDALRAFSALEGKGLSGGVKDGCCGSAWCGQPTEAVAPPEEFADSACSDSPTHQRPVSARNRRLRPRMTPETAFFSRLLGVDAWTTESAVWLLVARRRQSRATSARLHRGTTSLPRTRRRGAVTPSPR